MDQVRTVLAWLKKHHFWLLVGLVGLIGLFSWWSAASSLSAQYRENESKIKAGFQGLDSLKSNPFHPNQVINERQAIEIKKAADDVNAIWQRLYDRQREQVLEWPASLSQAFRDRVEKLDFGQDIPPQLRQNYQDYVERHFPKLPEKIGARALREGETSPFGGGGPGGGREMGGRMFMGEGGPGMMPGAEEEEDDRDYIVEWFDQGRVRDELNFPQRPSAIRIWWTQENLWVYHTLLNVIRNTNEAAGATRMSNAAVRSIYSLEVGRGAALGSRTSDRIYKVPVAAAGGGMGPGMEMMGPEGEGGMRELGEGPGGMGPDMAFRGESGLMGQGPLSPEQEAAILFSHRYLGDDGKPIPAGGGGGGELGGEMADAGPPAPVDFSTFGREYKRLPIRMVLHMDQRWLPELIAECASQPLQVEVQEVRINPADGGGLEGGGMPGGFGGGFRGGFEGGMMGGSMFPERTGLLTFPQQPHMVNVVIQGVIYIFNKPDPSVLESTDEAASMAGL